MVWYFGNLSNLGLSRDRSLCNTIQHRVLAFCTKGGHGHNLLVNTLLTAWSHFLLYAYHQCRCFSRSWTSWNRRDWRPSSWLHPGQDRYGSRIWSASPCDSLFTSDNRPYDQRIWHHDSPQPRVVTPKGLAPRWHAGIPQDCSAEVLTVMLNSRKPIRIIYLQKLKCFKA